MHIHVSVLPQPPSRVRQASLEAATGPTLPRAGMEVWSLLGLFLHTEPGRSGTQRSSTSQGLANGYT